MPHVIVLNGSPRYMPERLAGEANILPGHLLMLVSGELKKHDTAGGDAMGAWAVESSIPKRDAPTEAIDTAYDDGSSVAWVVSDATSAINALIADGADAVVEGDPLESAGDGTVQKHVPVAIAESGSSTVTIQTEAVVGYAAEDMDNSGGTAPVRLRVNTR